MVASLLIKGHQKLILRRMVKKDSGRLIESNLFHEPGNYFLGVFGPHLSDL